MKKKAEVFYKRAFMLVLAVYLFVAFAMPAKAEGIAFTQEEKEYLAEAKILKVVSIDGAAPLHYLCIAYLQKKEPKAIITFYPAEMHAFTLCPSDKHSINPCLFSIVLSL